MAEAVKPAARFARPKKVVDSKTTSYFNCILYGPPGCGKTTCAATAPAPVLFLDCDEGLETLRSMDAETARKIGIKDLNEIYFETIRSLKDILVQINRVKEECAASPGHWATVCLDNLTELQRILMNDILRSQERVLPQQQDWGVILQRVQTIVREVRNLPCHSVFIAHERQTENGITLALSGSIETEIHGFVDLVARYTLVEKEIPGPDGKPSLRQVRKLRCQPLLGVNPVRAKTRGWKLDEWEEPHLGHIIDKLRTK
jgi:AAA domain